MIFGILAFLLLLISICIKDRKRSLTVQFLNCSCEAAYNFAIHALTGAVLSIMNCIRSFLFIHKEKFSPNMYLGILFIFETISIVTCIFTWEDWISLLPTIGTMFRTYCLWQSNMKLVRISGVVSAIFYGTYYCYHSAWILAFGNLILLFVSITSLYQYDFKKVKH